MLAGQDKSVNDSAVKVKWGYKGDIVPERWGKLTPAFALCATGKMQSPIDITQKIQIVPHGLSWQYQSAPMIIMDNGDTPLNLDGHQMIINEGHGVQLNFKDSPPREMITFLGNPYRLVEFHFHSPSENRWHGQSFPMEMHFVHQGKAGKVAVIGVFVKAGEANPAIQQIVENLPKVEGRPFTIKGKRINPADLMPHGKAYYHFKGSLTTPPCSEGLQWVVMADAITASPAQIALLRKAMGGDNARAVQPLNHRQISFSAEEN
ncbi:MAG: hypothetical protein A3E85_01935 [Gammaproteobacteria bacterium RIFCSPHIGHO2_12_FULL_45_12]|nr:MAG: hypothetical protein A3E85_01935 [Gammaproteobacteria bacterium RIFCSPHIGHO2_12_FULL_45_12]